VIVKELVDKALDACEEAGIAPPRHLAGGKILVPELAFAATPHVVYDGVSTTTSCFRRYGQGKIRSGEGDY
jgi:hypothetical protein